MPTLLTMQVSPGHEEEEAVLTETQHSGVAVFAHKENHGNRQKDAVHPSSGHSAKPHALHAAKHHHHSVRDQPHRQSANRQSSASSLLFESTRLSKHG